MARRAGGGAFERMHGKGQSGSQAAQFRPQVSGTIEKLCVTEGQKVRRGQLLFIIDQVPYRAALKTATANVEAARAANIHEDIENMPDGYETQVGERGVRLSGGQKQRIAIARAILRRSPIIILDEATASVDVETERQIQKAIGAIAGKRTIVAIAHRLSTIRWADQILVIQEGRIAEAGNHEQLLQKNGIYARMYRVQNAEARGEN